MNDDHYPADENPAALGQAMEAASAATRSFGVETARTLRAASEEYRRAAATGRDFGDALANAFTNAAVKGRSLSDTLKKLALDLSAMVLSSATRAIGNSLTGALSGAFSGILASADGNVFAGGRVKPFARGGVLSSPMLFPLQDGLGLAGEAGAEAILPLRRGSDGRLGVAASGGTQPVQVTFNVTAADAGSFRRSETQIAAMLARVTSRGARNL